MRKATDADAEELSRLYALVFATYPTPMNDPQYIRKTMKEGTIYYVVEYDGTIACAASAEVTERMGSAEMTDCATHPNHAGKGLLQPLFMELERRMEEAGIYYLYTLTRAQSAGNPIAGGVTIGSGVGPTKINQVIGVAKAYTTRVGDGPFLTELTDATGDHIREVGAEYGTTTGRARRVGWFDSVVV